MGSAAVRSDSTDHTVSLLHSVNSRHCGDLNESEFESEINGQPMDSPPSRSSTLGKGSGHCGLSVYRMGWICFFILGVFNNFINVVIISSAKQLAESFGASNLIGFVSWSLTSISFFTKMANTLYLQRTTHRIRVLFTVGFNVMGVLTLSLSLYAPSTWIVHHFGVALGALMVLGGACSFGENVVVGFLRMFPPKLSGAWSSGTGFAGLFGSVFYLWTATILHLEMETIYLLVTPSMMLYLMAFMAMNRSALKMGLEPTSTATLNADTKSVDVLEESSICRLARCYRLCLFRAWMMGSVYLFEYIISVGLASICNSNQSPKDQDDIYIDLSACYQIGVFVSRSSISWWSTDRFGVLALMQFLNVLLWHSQCQWLWMSRWVGLWLEYVLMVYVGMLGGLMYVNVIHDILCDIRNIPNQNDRELCLNIVLVHIVFGMFSSAAYTVVMDNTFFSHLVNASD